MKKYLTLVILFSIVQVSIAQTPLLPTEAQINLALQAAPEIMRTEATVLGFSADGKVVLLRQGSNNLICLGDNPKGKGINVACYAKELEPFMARGRALVAEGKSEAEKRETRKKEIDNGTLKMPKEPAIVYVLTAEDTDLDQETGDLKNSYIRFVFYKPYMTPEETGLPTRPQGPGVPWLMDAGTHRSHIMITPARNK